MEEERIELSEREREPLHKPDVLILLHLTICTH